ncbi:MAG: hypothetical protein HY286_07790 [Planctomycetes bacterium]|nr:hypothetical protein [Planctomycetota bacterium]
MKWIGFAPIPALMIGIAGLALSLAAASASTLTLTIASVPRIADPKLDGGAIPIQFVIGPDGISAAVDITIEQNAATVASVFSGTLTGAANTIVTKNWNGKTANGKFADPGDYTVRIVATADHVENQTAPLSIVRLGISAMEALGVNNNDEWQMVYFMKGGTTYAFYATPSVHEYYNVNKPGDVADLDLNNGNPRPSVALHEDVMSPPLSGTNYESYNYNFPYCYLDGKTPRLRVTFGSNATSQAGTAVAPGYPVAGYEIHAIASDPNGGWINNDTNITPAGQSTFDGPALPTVAGRSDRNITWKFEYRTAGGGAWNPVPGQIGTHHRYYTVINKPIFATGATGTQYAGPWVMIAETFTQWANDLGNAPSDEHGVVDTIIKGYFGQNAGVHFPIENFEYDCPSMGGDGGATHYYDFGGNSIPLSRVLNYHQNGIYINCSDCASITSTMIAMLGVRSVQMFRLGGMTLKAIWGVGTPAYTTNLWGPGSNSFSYHHIITRNGGVNVSDACMCVDEDGNPGATPGVPGWNVDRPWLGASGYMTLSAYNTVSTSFDPLPKIQ